jgi:uncharacterized membrane protein
MFLLWGKQVPEQVPVTQKLVTFAIFLPAPYTKGTCQNRCIQVLVVLSSSRRMMSNPLIGLFRRMGASGGGYAAAGAGCGVVNEVVPRDSPLPVKLRRNTFFTSIIEPNTNRTTGNNDSSNHNRAREDHRDDNLQHQQQQQPKRHPVLERPCSVILAEEFITVPPLAYDTRGSRNSSSSSSSSNDSSSCDSNSDRNNSHQRNRQQFTSWHTSMKHTFPQQFGIAYAQWSLINPDDYDYEKDVMDKHKLLVNRSDDSDTHNHSNHTTYSDKSKSRMQYKDDYDSMTFDFALSKMKEDLRTYQTTIQSNPTILITRGPVLSWMAQFYLESLPLAGLVMIDPIPFTTRESYQLYSQTYFPTTTTPSSQRQQPPNQGDRILPYDYYSILQDYDNHWDHWTLKIEPASIPMLILSTMISQSMIENTGTTSAKDDGNDESSNDDDESFNMMNSMFQIEDNHASSSHNNAIAALDIEALSLWRDYATQTAQRHAKATTSTETTSTTTMQSVPVLDVDPQDVDQISTTIHDWINDRVL